MDNRIVARLRGKCLAIEKCSLQRGVGKDDVFGEWHSMQIPAAAVSANRFGKPPSRTRPVLPKTAERADQANDKILSGE